MGLESDFVRIPLHGFFWLIGWKYYLAPRFLKNFWVKAIGGILNAFGFRARVIEQNLIYAFPGDSAAALAFRKRMKRNAYEHLAKLVFEILMLLGPLPRFIRKKGVKIGLEHWDAANAKGRGVFFLSSHVGNWELMAGIGGMLHGIDIQLVTKHLKPEWLHRAVEQGRKRVAVKAAYEPHTMKDILRHIKNQGSVGFVLDKYAGPPVGVRYR